MITPYTEDAQQVQSASSAKQITYMTPGLSFDRVGIEQAHFFLQSESGQLRIEDVKPVKKK